MQKNNTIRKIYLYLFALLGLTLLVIGAVMLIDLGLKIFVFKKADIESVQKPTLIYMRPGEPIKEEDFISAIEKCEEKCDLTEEQNAQIQNWLTDYGYWQEAQLTNNNYATRSRHRQASMSLSLILIGLPLYLFHWAVIKGETKT